jgi:hypothetical protein
MNPSSSARESQDHVTSEMVELTPGTAVNYLLNNFCGRPLRRQKVQAISRDMLADDWLYTGDPLRFAAVGPDDRIEDEQGGFYPPGTELLIDGQHRLHGLLLAGRAQPNIKLRFKVERGYRYEVMRVLDTGSVRDVADTLEIEGVHNAKLVTAIVRRVHQYAESTSLGGRRNRVTPSEIIRAFNADPAGFQVSAEFARRHTRPLIPASLSGWLHYTLCRVDADLATDYLERLHDGVGLHEDHPVLTLRERIDKERDAARRGSHRMSEPTLAVFCIITWNHLHAAKRRGVKPVLRKIQLPKGGIDTESFKIRGFKSY